MELLYTIEQRNHREGRSDIVDYADLEATLRPYVQKELLHVRVDSIRDARVMNREQLTGLESTLFRELADAEAAIQQRRPKTADA